YYVLYTSIDFFFSSRRRHTIFSRDWSSDVCSSDLFAGTFRLAVLQTVHLNATLGHGTGEHGFHLLDLELMVSSHGYFQIVLLETGLYTTEIKAGAQLAAGLFYGVTGFMFINFRNHIKRRHCFTPQQKRVF